VLVSTAECDLHSEKNCTVPVLWSSTGADGKAKHIGQRRNLAEIIHW